MDEVLLRHTAKITPSFNPSVANGLATEHMKNLMAYIDRLFYASRDVFPEGFEYLGSRICTPREQFLEVTREYESKRQANIARDDVFMACYEFAYKGERLLPRYVLLPFVRDGGLIHLNGGLYNISPVLADVGYSVNDNTIFVQFRRVRLNFKHVHHHVLVNDRRETMFQVYSQIHHLKGRIKKQDLSQREDIMTTLAHYFFCRFGFRQTLERWAHVDVELGWLRDFPEDQYPRDKYYVCRSAKLLGRHPNDQLAIVYPVHQHSQLAKMFVVGAFYVIDTFPNFFNDPEYIDDIGHWRRLLGHLIFGDYKPTGGMLEDVDTHMNSIESYLDDITREDLREGGLNVTTLYDLFIELMTNLSHHFYTTNADEASVYNKRMMVLRYVMNEFNEAISNLGFDFQDKKYREWSVAELNKILRSRFKLNTAKKRLSSWHGEINAVSYPGSNKIFRITSMLIPQDQANRRGSSHNKDVFSDPSRRLHASWAEVCSYCNLPKNDPIGINRIGPCVNIDHNGSIIRDPDKYDLIESTQKRLQD